MRAEFVGGSQDGRWLDIPDYLSEYRHPLLTEPTLVSPVDAEDIPTQRILIEKYIRYAPDKFKYNGERWL